MTSNNITTAVAVFPSREQAEAALAELDAAGFRAEEVGWAMLGEGGETALEHEAAHTAAGAASGALSGGVIGGLGLAAVSLLIPGLGPIIGGGILATVLGGAALGAAGGGLLGALTGLGLGEEEATYYTREFQSGRPVLAVNAGDRLDEAAAILSRNGGYDYTTRDATQMTPP